jgi:glutamate/tyrosine decarboxylase-like PLP-dependent enzyme
MTVIDLAHHNSHGKRRIIAALEHKQRQERESTRQKSDQDSRLRVEHSLSASATKPAWSGQTMTEQEAQQLANQALQDGQNHQYNLNAYSVFEQNLWVVKVHLEQHIFTIHNLSEWSQELTGIHEVLQLRKKLSSTGKGGIS